MAAVSLASATDETKLYIWLSPSAKQRRIPYSGPPHAYQDLSIRHYWSVNKVQVKLSKSFLTQFNKWPV